MYVFPRSRRFDFGLTVHFGSDKRLKPFSGPISRSRLELYSFQQRQLVRATSKAKGASDRRRPPSSSFQSHLTTYSIRPKSPLSLCSATQTLFSTPSPPSHSSAPPPFVEGGGDMGTQWVLEENACMWAAEGVRPEHGCHSSDHISLSVAKHFELFNICKIPHNYQSKPKQIRWLRISLFHFCY